MPPDFISDAEMAALEGGSSAPDFISDEEMASLESAGPESSFLSDLGTGLITGPLKTGAGVLDLVSAPFEWASDKVLGTDFANTPGFTSEMNQKTLPALEALTGINLTSQSKTRKLAEFLSPMGMGNLGMQAVGGTGAFIGSEAAEALFPESKTAQFILPLLTGTAASMGISSAPRIATAAMESAVGPQTKASIERAAGQELLDMGVTPQSLRRSVIPETVGEATMLPEVLAKEREIFGSTQAAKMSEFLQGRGDIRERYLSKLDVPNAEGADTLRNAGLMARSAVENSGLADDAIETLGEAMTKAESGPILKGEAKAVFEAERRAAGQAYENLDKSAPVPIYEAKVKLWDEAYKLFPEGEVPKELADDLAWKGKGEFESLVSLDEAIKLRSKYGKLAEAASDPVRKRFFGKMRGELGNAIDEAPNHPFNNGLPQETANAWRAANSKYREYASTYRQGAVGKIVGKRAYGEEKLLPSQVPNKVIESPESLKQYVKAVKGSEEAMEAVRGYVAYKSIKNGKVDLKAIKNITDTLGDALDDVPGLRSRLEAASKSQAKAEKLVKDFKDTLLDKLSRERGAEPVVESLLNGPLDIIKSLKAPHKKGGLIERNLAKTGLDVALKNAERMNRPNFVRWIADREKNLTEIVGPRIYKRLKTYANSVEKEYDATKLGKAGAMGGSDTSQKFGNAMKGFLRKAGSATSGMVGLGTSIANPAVGIPVLAASGAAALKTRSLGLIEDALAKGLLNKPEAARLIKEASKPGAPLFKEPSDVVMAVVKRDAIESAMDRAEEKVMTEQKPEKAKPQQVESKLLDAVEKAESGGRADAVGPKTKYGTAKGAYQLLDATGKEQMKKVGLNPDDYNPFDKELSRKLAANYLGELMKRYGGNERLALAAYNWGMGNLGKLMTKLGTMNYDKLEASLPDETRKYVKKVISYKV